MPPLISTGTLTRRALEDRVAVVTGAGRGLGFEAARALAWLGARVVVAEIDAPTGRGVAERINAEFGANTALFVRTDVGDERSVARLARTAERACGKVDIVLNNAAIAPTGPVKDTPIVSWDASYRVNLRGPVLLARSFLPGMLGRGYGVFVCVVSEGLAYMGPYETLKAAQAHLAATLDAELEGTGVVSFAIGPGLARTPGAEEQIPKIAPYYGKTVEEFYDLSREHIISVEAGGAGFAAAVALAERFRGQSIGSKQALIAAGIDIPEEGDASPALDLPPEQLAQALDLCHLVRTTLAEQSQGWQERPLFERQWVVRDFKKNAGLPVEQWLEELARMESCLTSGDLTALARLHAPVDLLAAYYARQQEMAKGYIKDPVKLEESLKYVRQWQTDAEQLAALLQGK